ncbi:Aste57867_22547 [Aphanomyces stellatus]|uniref:Aste57867_22547 protein n=1 Tax=Aphanomyces stellatus TaxID=120398 RepID=A0A485LL78_9STRA|nr:hypothetical protein As57867_022477 [Aphanomyces stellatus]VFT99207.1 Aste57867_22547 [Aphanomyces stellatus]
MGVRSVGGTDATPNDAAADRVLDLMVVLWTFETKSHVSTFLAPACGVQTTRGNDKANNDHPDRWSVLSLLSPQKDTLAKTFVVDDANVVLAVDHALEGTNIVTSEAKCTALNAVCRLELIRLKAREGAQQALG